jgi:hypothetical protein
VSSVCLPLIERELRVALRKQRPARSRFLVAAISVFASILFLIAASLSGGGCNSARPSAPSLSGAALTPGFIPLNRRSFGTTWR